MLRWFTGRRQATQGRSSDASAFVDRPKVKTRQSDSFIVADNHADIGWWYSIDLGDESRHAGHEIERNVRGRIQSPWIEGWSNPRETCAGYRL
jgi:hypothetical protein